MSDPQIPSSAPSSASSSSVDIECAEDLPCSFAQFMVSLASSALVNLGEVVDPAVGKAQHDLVLARHSINILVLLRAKTKGNLDTEEARLLDALLDDLNAKYAAARAG